MEEFLASCVKPDKGATIGQAFLFSAYCTYVGVEHISPSSFTNAMVGKGHVLDRGRSCNTWKDLSLIDWALWKKVREEEQKVEEKVEEKTVAEKIDDLLVLVVPPVKIKRAKWYRLWLW